MSLSLAVSLWQCSNCELESNQPYFTIDVT